MVPASAEAAAEMANVAPPTVSGNVIGENSVLRQFPPLSRSARFSDSEILAGRGTSGATTAGTAAAGDGTVKGDGDGDGEGDGEGEGEGDGEGEGEGDGS